MVDTNQDSSQKEERVKKKKQSPRAVAKTKDEKSEPALKKAPVKKEAKPVKTQSSAKAVAGKGQTLAKLKKFLKGAWSELKKVHWPNRQQLVSFTGVVLVAVGIVTVMIFLVDSLLSELLKFVIPE
ncbi:MAG: preprotein translocase subunit SecE [Firmicutes bacterium HGW-Firmicutes-14]|nr:MAG: preprotein translocase subunit SecE [Firmicutes bacterium HGW-Firmicutes-14]